MRQLVALAVLFAHLTIRIDSCANTLVRMRNIVLESNTIVIVTVVTRSDETSKLAACSDIISDSDVYARSSEWLEIGTHCNAGFFVN